MKNMIASPASVAVKSWLRSWLLRLWTPSTTGRCFKRKEDMHRMAEANRAFAHFRF
jgi:hypothetical protein